MRRLTLAALALTVGATGATAQSPGCEWQEGRPAIGFTGEISGQHPYYATVGPGWTMALEPAPHGWHLRLYDADGLDLTQITPPFRGAPNPREIYGWHFRNAGNTAANDGSVNAPQELRLFYFDPDLSGAAGFMPPDDGGFEPDPTDGRGFLRILDYGLADLDPGETARMVYLLFEVCFVWTGDFTIPVDPS